MGGLVTQAPRLAGFWLVAAASVIGVPLLAGFTGDFMVFAGSFPEHRIATVLVMASVIVTTGGLAVGRQSRVLRTGSRPVRSRA